MKCPSLFKRLWFSLPMTTILLSVCSYNLYNEPDNLAGFVIPLSFIIMTLPPFGLFPNFIMWKVTKWDFFKPCDYVKGKYSFFGRDIFLSFRNKKPESLSNLTKLNWSINQGEFGMLDFVMNNSGEILNGKINGKPFTKVVANKEILINNLNLWEGTNSRVVESSMFVLHVKGVYQVLEDIDKKYLTISYMNYILISGMNDFIGGIIGLISWVGSAIGILLAFYLSNKTKYNKSIWGFLPIGVIGFIHLFYIIADKTLNNSNRNYKDGATKKAILSGVYLEKLEEEPSSNMVWCDPFSRKKVVSPDNVYCLDSRMHSSLDLLYGFNKIIKLNSDLEGDLSDFLQNRKGVRTLQMKNNVRFEIEFSGYSPDEMVKISYGLLGESKLYCFRRIDSISNFDSRIRSLINFTSLASKKSFTTVLESRQDLTNKYHAMNLRLILSHFINSEVFEDLHHYYKSVAEIIIGEKIVLSPHDYSVYELLKSTYKNEVNKIIFHNKKFFKGDINFSVMECCFLKIVPMNKGKCGSSVFKKYTADLKYLFGEKCLNGMLKCCCFRGPPSQAALEAETYEGEFEICETGKVYYETRPDFYERVKSMNLDKNAKPIMHVDEEMKLLEFTCAKEKEVAEERGEKEDEEGVSKVKRALTEVEINDLKIKEVLNKKEHLKFIDAGLHENLMEVKGTLKVLNYKALGGNGVPTEEFMKEMNRWVRENSIALVKSSFNYKRNVYYREDKPNDLLAADFGWFIKAEKDMKNKLKILEIKSKLADKAVNSYLEDEGCSKEKESRLINILTTTETNKSLLKLAERHYYDSICKVSHLLLQLKTANSERNNKYMRRKVKRSKKSKFIASKVKTIQELTEIKSEFAKGDNLKHFLKDICDKYPKDAKKRMLSLGWGKNKGERTRKRISNLLIKEIEIQLFGFVTVRIKDNLRIDEKVKKGRKKGKQGKKKGKISKRSEYGYDDYYDY